MNELLKLNPTTIKSENYHRNMPEKIKFKLTKDEFIYLNKLTNILVMGFKDPKLNEIEIMCQIILTKFNQKTAKMLIPIKSKYNFNLETEVACALFSYLQAFLLLELGIFERNVIDKIISQIHKEVLI